MLIDSQYDCIFCDLCSLPADTFLICKYCSIYFHPTCLPSHNCKTCKYCIQNSCLKKFELKRNINIFKGVKSNKPENYFALKRRTKGMDDLIREAKPKDPESRLRDLIETPFIIHGCDIKNKDCLNEIVTIYADIFTFTLFFNKVYYIKTCEACCEGFHALNNETVCEECFKCHNCEVIDRTTAYSIYRVRHYKDDSDEFINILYCLKCFDSFVKTSEICPLCLKAYTMENMLECDGCYRWIHYACDSGIDPNISDDNENTFYCKVCKIYEGIWVNKPLIVKNEDIGLCYDLRIMPLNRPKCYFCHIVHSGAEASIMTLVKISAGRITIFAHKICLLSCADLKNGDIPIKNAMNKCKGCNKTGATIKCIYCIGKYYHYDCALNSKDGILRSNLIFPICTLHLTEKTCEIYTIEKMCQSLKGNLKQAVNSENEYLKIRDYSIRQNGSFTKLIFGSDENLIFKCDLKHLYLNNIEIPANEINYRLKHLGYNLKVNGIISQALDYGLAHSDRFTGGFKDPRKTFYNPCIPLNFQLNNFTLSYISSILQRNNLILKDSNIHGKGVFAKRLFYPNEILVQYEGEIIDISEANTYEKLYQNLDCYLFKTSENIIDATFMGNIAKFINQSCVPNCYSTEAMWDNKRGILICAKTVISMGEELTYKYGFTGKKMECNCGASNCKRTLN